MDNLDLARWQFAITTVYHFLFVPVTIGLSALVAWYHTAWVAPAPRGRPAAGQVLRQALHDQLRAGAGHRHRPGVPVRHELVRLQPVRRRHLRRTAGHRGAARVLPRVDLPRAVDLRLGPHPREAARRRACGSSTSAPCCRPTSSSPRTRSCRTRSATATTPQTGRAELTDFVAVLTNKVQLVTFPHVVAAAYMVGGAMVMARRAVAPASRGRGRGTRGMYRRATRLGAVVTLVAGLAVAVTGDVQGKIMTEVQPMKMAAAEALYDELGRQRALLAADGRLARRLRGEVRDHRCPACSASWRPGTSTAASRASTSSRREYAQKYGTGQARSPPTRPTRPNIPLSYWSFRLMIGVGLLAAGSGRS